MVQTRHVWSHCFDVKLPLGILMCSPLSVPLALVVLLWDSLFLSMFAVSLSLSLSLRFYIIFLSLSLSIYIYIYIYFNLSLSLWLHSLILSHCSFLTFHLIFPLLSLTFLCVYVLTCFSSLFSPLCHFLFSLSLSIYLLFLFFVSFWSLSSLSLISSSPLLACSSPSILLFPSLWPSLPETISHPPPQIQAETEHTKIVYD